MGNYDTATGGTGRKQVSGYKNDYGVKQVYDLGGNLWDWTSEAEDFNLRIPRGGIYNRSGSDYPVRSSSFDFPVASNTGNTARLTLYVTL